MDKVYVVRHGQTFWNRDCVRGEDGKRRYNGREIGRDFNPGTNPEVLQLTPEGHHQAERVADKLVELVGGEVIIYSSAEQRAIETATPTARTYGRRIMMDSRLNEYTLERGDSSEEAYQRMNGFVQDLAQRKEEQAVIFGHGNLLTFYFSKDNPNFHFVRNCEIVMGEIEERGRESRIKALERIMTF